jgi:hypothetical protein
MTHTLSITNVNHAYVAGVNLIRDIGVAVATRNGPAFRAPGTVVTTFHHPMERVLFDSTRDANPFFHLFESLWILAGREDVRPLAFFNKRMANYSDDGERFHGAYGWRLRYGFGVDQIDRAITMLRRNPLDRRVVLSIWHPALDLGTDSADIPCNDMLKLSSDGAQLDLVVFNRSNDILWGAYGANAVQFAFLLEYLAAGAGLRPGRLVQVSTDWHWYGSDRPAPLVYTPTMYDQRPNGAWRPLLAAEETLDQLDDDLELLFDCMEAVATRKAPECLSPSFYTAWMATVAWPMFTAWLHYKSHWLDGEPKTPNLPFAMRTSYNIAAPDWSVAALNWLERRYLKTLTHP